MDFCTFDASNVNNKIMDEPIKQIAERLRGLRDALNLGMDEMATACQMDIDRYREIESGNCDLSVSLLQKIASQFNIPLDVLMFGEEPKMSAYFLTRSGAGISVERTKAYKYQALASGFRNRKADPFLVTVEPKPDDVPMYFNIHTGQEFNLVIEGRMLLEINGKELTLNAGDSLYFDSSLPHGMKALDGKPVKFLAIVIQ